MENLPSLAVLRNLDTQGLRGMPTFLCELKDCSRKRGFCTIGEVELEVHQRKLLRSPEGIKMGPLPPAARPLARSKLIPSLSSLINILFEPPVLL